MTSFFEQGFKLLLVAWPEGIALFIGAFFVLAQGITTAHDHPPVVTVPQNGVKKCVRHPKGWRILGQMGARERL